MNSLELSDRWKEHFMTLARACAGMSKDPSTKVGSIIVRPDRTVASTGFNGYPRGCKDEDYNDRERKYQRIIHAEMNAILTAKEPLNGYTLFSWPIPPCDRCIPHIIQSGIKQLILPSIHESHRWAKRCIEAQAMAEEAGLTVVIWDLI